MRTVSYLITTTPVLRVTNLSSCLLNAKHERQGREHDLNNTVDPSREQTRRLAGKPDARKDLRTVIINTVSSY